MENIDDVINYMNKLTFIHSLEYNEYENFDKMREVLIH